MVHETKEITFDNISFFRKNEKQAPRKTLADIYGKLKRGIDGLEYQKIVRNEWY